MPRFDSIRFHSPLTARLAGVAAAAAFLLTAAVTNAEIVYESGTSTGPAGGGFILGGGPGYQKGSRFHLDVPTEIQSAGGRVSGSAPNIRVSIVALAPTLPPATPATFTPIISAVVSFNGADADLVAPLPVILPPGDYGIVMNNVDPAGNDILMPFENTQNPGASFFSGTTSPDEWVDGLPDVIPGFYPRFFVYNGCGNATTAPNEECDDGNTVDNDGCDSNCTFTGCGNRVLTSGEACDDGNDIDGDGCDSDCSLTACGNGIVTTGEQCDDGNLEPDDCCDEVCALPSVSSCALAGAGSLTSIDNVTDAKDKLVWKWSKGGAVDLADFGDPSATTSLHLCITQGPPTEGLPAYDSDRLARGGPPPSPKPIADIAMAPDAAWSSNGKLWKLASKTPSPGLNGMRSGSLKPGIAGKSSVALTGGGEALPDFPFASSGAVSVTLRASNGKCWTSGDMDIVKATDSKLIIKHP